MSYHHFECWGRGSLTPDLECCDLACPAETSAHVMLFDQSAHKKYVNKAGGNSCCMSHVGRGMTVLL